MLHITFRLGYLDGYSYCIYIVQSGISNDNFLHAIQFIQLYSLLYSRAVGSHSKAAIQVKHEHFIQYNMQI